MAKRKGKQGKRPPKSIKGAKIIKGAKKGLASKGEVAGHTSPGAYYWCWNCVASNYVPWGWNYFYCWNCHALNRV